MPGPSSRTRAQIVATLAALQTGIEPATLTLLVANHAVNPADLGWVVSVGQIGMAGGALLGWRRNGAGHARGVGAPAIGVGACLAMMVAHDLIAVLALRFVLGVVMGLLLTHATAVAARRRPQNAIGIIILAQQLISTAVLAGLPLMAAAWGPVAALGALATAPLVIALLMLVPTTDAVAAPPVEATVDEATAPAAEGTLMPMAMIVAVTMMLWSYVATMGSAVGLGDVDVGFAIALGSLASAPAAALAAFFGPRLPPWLTAVVCGAGMLSPLVVPADTGLTGYLTALALFNAGSTFGSIRFTAWAMRVRERQRSFATMIQCLAMAVGPALGAVAMRAGGLSALAALATAGVTVAVVVPVLRKIDRARRPALDAALTA